MTRNTDRKKTYKPPSISTALNSNAHPHRRGDAPGSTMNVASTSSRAGQLSPREVLSRRSQRGAAESSTTAEATAPIPKQATMDQIERLRCRRELDERVPDVPADDTTTENNDENRTIDNDDSTLFTREEQSSPISQVKAPSPVNRNKAVKWYADKRLAKKLQSYLSSSAEDNETNTDEEDSSTLYEEQYTLETFEEEQTLDTLSEDYYQSPITKKNRNGRRQYGADSYQHTKQTFAYATLSLIAGQLGILLVQITLCGIAPFEINPMIGPFPDTFSEWGGKNTYLMIVEDQLWRFITPSFLHSGLLHFLCNAFCSLTTINLFEREWGTPLWLFIYLVSAVSSLIFSSYFDPDTISVSSSASLIGMYAAKLAQIMMHTFFKVKNSSMDSILPITQVGNILCSLILISITSVFKFTDWSGHCGGLACGFLAGMVIFGGNIRNVWIRIIWLLLGFAGLIFCISYVLKKFLFETEISADLSDACEYFMNMNPDVDYVCGCMEE